MTTRRSLLTALSALPLLPLAARGEDTSARPEPLVDAGKVAALGGHPRLRITAAELPVVRRRAEKTDRGAPSSPPCAPAATRHW